MWVLLFFRLLSHVNYLCPCYQTSSPVVKMLWLSLYVCNGQRCDGIFLTQTVTFCIVIILSKVWYIRMDDVLWGFYYLTQLLHSSMQQDEATWKGSVYKWMDLENWTTSNLYAEIFYAFFPCRVFWAGLWGFIQNMPFLLYIIQLLCIQNIRIINCNIKKQVWLINARRQC